MHRRSNERASPLVNALFDPYLLTFISILVGFVVFKAAYLDLPFFWDEAWVYAPAVQAMYHNGLSLFPDAMDPQLSRGHPLLFHFTCGMWMHVFGTSRESLHSFALTISVGLLVATYSCGRMMGSRQIGLGAVLLLLANEAFLAQSGILLPEVMLALLGLLSALFYVKRKPVAYMVMATCVLMTKESGVVLILSLLLWHLVLSISQPAAMTSKERRNWILFLIVPVVLATIYFLYQRLLLGWVFYPEHLNMLTWDQRSIVYKAKLAFSDLFEDQGQVFVLYTFAFALPALWRGLDRRRSVLVILLFITAIKVLYGKWSVPSVGTVLVPLICFSLIFQLYILRLHEKLPRWGEIVCIGFIFTLGFVSFSALNFFSDRYLVCLLPFIALGIATLLQSVLAPYHKALPLSSVVVLAGIMLSQVKSDWRTGDTKLNYADAIEVDRRIVSFCEDQDLQNDKFYGSFTHITYMTRPDAGYLSGPTVFKHVFQTISDSTTYAIFTNMSPGSMLERRQQMGFTLWARFESGKAWGEIYRR